MGSDHHQPWTITRNIAPHFLGGNRLRREAGQRSEQAGCAAEQESPTFPDHAKCKGGESVQLALSLGTHGATGVVAEPPQSVQDLDVGLLGMPPESDWVLNGPYSDKALMRNVLAYKWSNDIGRYATRTRFVEMYLKTGGSQVSSSNYIGVYVLIEKIKRNPERVNVTELEPADNSPPEITGGYILKKDRLDPGDQGFETQGGQPTVYGSLAAAHQRKRLRYRARFSDFHFGQ